MTAVDSKIILVANETFRESLDLRQGITAPISDEGTSVRQSPDGRLKISIVVPVYNEEENIETCYKALKNVFSKVADDYEFEILFSDNHSNDRTFEILAGIATKDPIVRVIRLARNYGFQRSVLTAFCLVEGDAAVQIDCDLQDPPELILDFLTLWRRGHDVVVGVRRKRPEGRMLQLARKGFYRMLRRISEDQLLDDAGDFRLVDRSVLERLKLVRDARPYTRGLVSALSANQTGLPYDRASREFGVSKFPLRRLIGFAMDGIINHSMVPLRLAGWIGAAVFLITFVMIIYYSIAFMLHGGNWPEGFATHTILLLASIGLNAILIAIVGEYTGRIYEDIKARPITIIQKSINIDTDTVKKTPD